jgi:hypothetical protein
MMWFDTKPLSFRDVQALPEISPDLMAKASTRFSDQIKREEQDHDLRQTIIDPKWVEIENQEELDENAMIELYERYGVPDPAAPEKPSLSDGGELSALGS